MLIAQLKAFIAIAESNSFSEAADKLFITQPAISKRIASLEEYYNARLLDRHGKQARLTEAGALLIPKARQILINLAESKQAIADMQDIVGGQLSIATSHHIGLRRLPALLRLYKSNHPDVKLDFHFMDSEEACRHVADGNIEMGIVTLPPATDPGLKTTLLWHDKLLLCCSVDHPLAGTIIKDPRQLCDYDAILPGKETFTRQIVDKYLSKSQCRLNIVMESNYLETLGMMAAVGIGWTVLPETMIGADILPVKIDDWDISRNLGIIQHKQRTLSNAATAMQNLLVANP